MHRLDKEHEQERYLGYAPAPYHRTFEADGASGGQIAIIAIWGKLLVRANLHGREFGVAATIVHVLAAGGTFALLGRNDAHITMGTLSEHKMAVLRQMIRSGVALLYIA